MMTNKMPSYRLLSCSLVVILATFTVQTSSTMSLCPAVDFGQDSSEYHLAEATTRLGINFLNNLTNKAKENAVISPLSLMNILNMVLLGTEDNSHTHEELASVLGYRGSASLSADRLKPHEASRNLCLDGDNFLGSQVNFSLANLVLTNRDLIELKPDYEKELGAYYKVKIDHFSRNESAAQKGSLPLHDRVNEWVKNQTQNQIVKLAEESDLSSNDLVMVLLNAAYFKARWLHTFNVRSTQERTFFNLGKEAADVKFMSQKGVFGYADFNTNSSQVDVLMSDSKTRPSDDDETLLTEDVAATAANATTGTSTSSASTSTTTTTTTTTTAKPNSQTPNVTVPQHQQVASAPIAVPAEASGSPPTIELSKEESRRLELTSKLNCSALMLPFSFNDGQELSMVILLPAKRDGLAELMANLNAQSLNEIYRSLTEQRVKVELPKFNFESSHDAKATLKVMGLNSIFEQSAELGRMYRLAGQTNSTTDSNSTASTGTGTKQGPVKVDRVIHKVKIGIDESGAEAAAASMVTLDLRNFVRPPTPTFVADHPFLFIIRHNRSNMPLFMGQVNRL